MAKPANGEHHRRRGQILERILAEGRAALRAQARRNAEQEADADDALQEACLQFLRYYDGPAGPAALKWLMLCLKHRCWEISQQRCRRESFAALSGTDAYDPAAQIVRLFSEDPGPEEWAERSEDVASFFAALDRLKPDQRTALLLLGLGYSYREIGDRQGWSQTKINRCLAEGRAALRALGRGESPCSSGS